MSPKVIFTRGSLNILQDLLFLAGIRVPLEDIKSWSAEQLDQAGTWAACAHIAPSYGGVVPPRPEFLRTEEMSNEQAKIA